MTTFAHTETGQALDPAVAPDAATYLARFNSAVTSGWNIVEVDDGTEQNATLGEDGHWVNPVVPARVPQPVVLEKNDFNLLCFTALGGLPEGLAAFQAIIDAAITAGGAAKGCITEYNQAERFDLPFTKSLFAILVANNCATQAQSDAVTGAWPVQ